jgi:hypothetical protein
MPGRLREAGLICSRPVADSVFFSKAGQDIEVEGWLVRPAVFSSRPFVRDGSRNWSAAARLLATVEAALRKRRRRRSGLLGLNLS